MKNKKTAVVYLADQRLVVVEGWAHWSTTDDDSGRINQYEFVKENGGVVALFPGHSVVAVVVGTDKKGKK